MDVDLHDDYTIENLMSTIINIIQEYDQNKAIVRTTRQPQNQSHKFKNTNRFNNNQLQYKRKHTRSQKFTKAQCNTCRQYGHIVTHCHLLPWVLAIINFAKKNGEKCEYLLKQHTQNNSVDSKKTFVRLLQDMNVLPQDDDSNHYMQDDIIINTVMDNVLISQEAISSEE